jgi:site-specific DNA recombinase
MTTADHVPDQGPAGAHPRLALADLASRRGRSLARQPAAVRAAFCGRTSTEDRQDPTLSLPRQLRASRAALPDGVAIVACFYDVESGRKDLAQRGHGQGHERFDIPIPRDGGIQDLLAEAQRPDRRFDIVICESVERIARRTYFGTHIEYVLEKAGVPLLASDEPITLTGRGATQTLTRRVKQGIAEWYVLEMLEKSRGGLEVHTEGGFNIGKPPYGYLADRIPHPVPAKRAEGKTKSRLIPDPEKAPAVRAIFEWRVGEQLGYKAIATRLNLYPDRYPPPAPVDPARAVGEWTPSAVYEVIHNPKHTGYMVWNRRATKSASGKVNPTSEWVWSAQPTHEPLVSRETFLAAQEIGPNRERSRGDAAPNRHRQTKRTYRLRGYLHHAGCGRRMYGKTRRPGNSYYACVPQGDRPSTHAKSLLVAENPLTQGVYDFFAVRIFGPDRSDLLAADLAEIDGTAGRDQAEQAAALRAALADIATRRKRLVRSLEVADDPDGELARDVNSRLIELRADADRLTAQLRDLEAHPVPVPAPALLDALPDLGPDLARLPDPRLRAIFDAFRFRIDYDSSTDTARCEVTITDDTLPAILAAVAGEPAEDAPFCVVPPAGFEPAHPPPEGGALSPELRGLGVRQR